MQDCFRQHPDIYGNELDDDDDGYEGDTEPPSPEIDDSASSRPSAGDNATSTNEVDQPSGDKMTSPKSTPPHPQVDEPSRYPQPPPDPPQPSSSAFKPVPFHERANENEPVAPNPVHDVDLNTKGK